MTQTERQIRDETSIMTMSYESSYELHRYATECRERADQVDAGLLSMTEAVWAVRRTIGL